MASSASVAEKKIAIPEKVVPRRIEVMKANRRKLVGLLYEEKESSMGIVVVCHGSASSKDAELIVGISESLSGRKLSVFRFDFSGIGESDADNRGAKDEVQVDDLCTVIHHFTSIKRRPISAIIGHETGAIIALLSIAKRTQQDVVPKLVSLSAPFNPEIWYVRQRGSHIPQDCRVLIVHGSSDETVSMEDAEEFAAVLPNNSLHIISEADHMYTLHRKELYIAVAYFLVDWAELLPEMVGKIGEAVFSSSIEDFLAMSSVCSSWRNLLRGNELKKKGLNVPLFMRRQKNKLLKNKLFFDSIMKQKSVMTKPDAYWALMNCGRKSNRIRYFGVGFGWMVARNEDDAVLCSPLHSNCFLIPSPYPLDIRESGIMRGALSADPNETENFSLVILWCASRSEDSKASYWMNGSFGNKLVPIRFWARSRVESFARSDAASAMNTYTRNYEEGGPSFCEDENFRSSNVKLGIDNIDVSLGKLQRRANYPFFERELKSAGHVTYVHGDNILGEEPIDSIHDVICYEGNFYFVSKSGRILKLETSQPPFSLCPRTGSGLPGVYNKNNQPISCNKGPSSSSNKYGVDSFMVASVILSPGGPRAPQMRQRIHYLVKSSWGTLLLLTMDSRRKDIVVLEVDLHKRDFRVDSLRDDALFLGMNITMALDTKDYAVIKPGKIYRTVIGNEEGVWIDFRRVILEEARHR